MGASEEGKGRKISRKVETQGRGGIIFFTRNFRQLGCSFLFLHYPPSAFAFIPTRRFTRRAEGSACIPRHENTAGFKLQGPPFLHIIHFSSFRVEKSGTCRVSPCEYRFSRFYFYSHFTNPLKEFRDKEFHAKSNQVFVFRFFSRVIFISSSFAFLARRRHISRTMHACVNFF